MSDTDKTDWHVPVEYIEAARACLGAIDLDPASSIRAQEVVRAARYLTMEEDALSQEWHGRIWLNPPYSHPEVSRLVDKLLAEYRSGHTHEAILFIHNYAEPLFEPALAECKAFCHIYHEVQLVDAEGKPATLTRGQAFFYFGPNASQFRNIFERFGDVFVSHSR
jgi:ParB family chromosome partitioning protein